MIWNTLSSAENWLISLANNQLQTKSVLIQTTDEPLGELCPFECHKCRTLRNRPLQEDTMVDKRSSSGAVMCGVQERWQSGRLDMGVHAKVNLHERLERLKHSPRIHAGKEGLSREGTGPFPDGC